MGLNVYLKYSVYQTAKLSQLSKYLIYFRSVTALMAVICMLGATMHYHSESMECLEDAHEEHYTDSTFDCPICVRIIHFTHPSLSETTVPLEATTDFVLPDFDGTHELFDSFKLGRAPPSLV